MTELIGDNAARLRQCQKARYINPYPQAVQAFVPPGWLTSSQALTALANAI